jgi:hypothetical protein
MTESTSSAPVSNPETGGKRVTCLYQPKSALIDGPVVLATTTDHVKLKHGTFKCSFDYNWAVTADSCQVVK